MLTFRVTLDCVLYESYSKLCYCKFRHIQPYCGIFGTLCNSWYSEHCHIKNLAYSKPEIYSELLSRHILLYLECYIMLTYWEPHHVQNFAILRILLFLGPVAYSETCLCRYIQAYSIMIVIIKLIFFFTLMLLFNEIKKNVFWLQWRQLQCSTKIQCSTTWIICGLSN